MNRNLNRPTVVIVQEPLTFLGEIATQPIFEPQPPQGAGNVTNNVPQGVEPLAELEARFERVTSRLQ